MNACDCRPHSSVCRSMFRCPHIDFHVYWNAARIEHEFVWTTWWHHNTIPKYSIYIDGQQQLHCCLEWTKSSIVQKKQKKKKFTALRLNCIFPFHFIFVLFKNYLALVLFSLCGHSNGFVKFFFIFASLGMFVFVMLRNCTKSPALKLNKLEIKKKKRRNRRKFCIHRYCNKYTINRCLIN